MTTRLTLTIQEHYEQLSPAERKLATLLLDRADDMLTYSATELAAMAGVSKATGARLFRSLGYADFNEVRLQAREERNLATPFQSPARAKAPQMRGHSIAAHLQTESFRTQPHRGAVRDLAGELTARGIDVFAARLANRGDQVPLHELVAELLDRSLR